MTRICNFSKVKCLSENQSYGKKQETLAAGLQRATEKGPKSPHCQESIACLSASPLPGGKHPETRELKGHQPRIQRSAGDMLIICGLMCVLKDVGQSEFPRYVPMFYCLPNNATHP